MSSLINKNFVQIVINFGKKTLDQAPKLGKWGIPAGVFGAWMVYPALPASWKL